MIRLLPMGERAVLAEVAALAEVLVLHARLRASIPDGVTDVVPAARTVLVQIDPAVLSLAQARAWIEQAARDVGSTAAQGGPGPAARTHQIDVRYDGPELDELAEVTGLGREALIDRHTSARWTVAFTGFAPGFGYLVSADWPFDIARRASPRTAVPAGAVGFAAEFCGVYPRETPGGWQLIGTTTATLFDRHAADPALLAPGDTVQFRVAT